MSDPGDAVRQPKGHARTQRTLRFNGTMLIGFVPPALLIGLGQVKSASDALLPCACCGLLLIAGLAARRLK